MGAGEVRSNLEESCRGRACNILYLIQACILSHTYLLLLSAHYL